MTLTLRAYDLDEEDILHAVRCLRAAVHGFVALEEVHGFGAMDTTATFTMLTQLHLDGFAAQSSTAVGHSLPERPSSQSG